MNDPIDSTQPRETPVPPRPTIIAYEKITENLLGGLVHVIVGAFFMCAGAWLVYYGLNHPITSVVNGATGQALNKPILIGGAATCVFGALLMPTILPLVKQIVVVVQSVPFIGSFIPGGRRASDPPASTEPPPDSRP